MAASWAQLSSMNLLWYTAWQCSVSRIQWVAMRHATWVRFLHSAESFYHSLPFCVALSPSVDWHERFLYCCTLYNFVFLEFCQWRSPSDRVLTFNVNIQLPLFGRTWRRATAQDSVTCAGLAYWLLLQQLYLLGEQMCLKRLGHNISLNCRKYCKTMAHAEGFPTLVPQTGASATAYCTVFQKQ